MKPINTKQAEKASKKRQDIQRLLGDLTQQTQSLLTHRALIKGYLFINKRRCGQKKCTCMTGELHQTETVSVKQKGRMTSMGLSTYAASIRERVRNKLKAYQSFRKTRARISKTLEHLIYTINQLEEALIEEVPIREKG